MAMSLVGQSHSLHMVSDVGIPSNEDLNDYTMPGTYTVANASVAETLSNCPFSSGGGRLEVIRINGSSNISLRQIYFANDIDIYTRWRNSTSGSNWSTWINVTNPVKNVTVGTITEMTCPSFGYITTSGTELSIFCPISLSTQIQSENTITISTLKIGLRIPAGGYVTSNNADVTQYITTIRVLSGFGLYIKLIKSGGWGLTNNIPVCGLATISGTIT